MDNIIRIAKELRKLYDESYNIYKSIVDNIINNQIKDINLIENTLDNILGIYTDKGFNLFVKLCTYYETVNKENAMFYFNFLKEEREEEYKIYVKKKKYSQ